MAKDASAPIPSAPIGGSLLKSGTLQPPAGAPHETVPLHGGSLFPFCRASLRASRCAALDIGHFTTAFSIERCSLEIAKAASLFSSFAISSFALHGFT